MWKVRVEMAHSISIHANDCSFCEKVHCAHCLLLFCLFDAVLPGPCFLEWRTMWLFQFIPYFYRGRGSGWSTQNIWWYHDGRKDKALLLHGIWIWVGCNTISLAVHQFALWLRVHLYEAFTSLMVLKWIQQEPWLKSQFFLKYTFFQTISDNNL